MRILYVLSALRHPAMRGELRHYHFLRILGRRHSVTLVARAKSAVPAGVIEELREYTEQLLIVDSSEGDSGVRDSGLRRRLARAQRFKRSKSQMESTLRELAPTSPFDVVLLHGTRIHRVLDGLPEMPVVFDMGDAASLRLGKGLLRGPMRELPLRVSRYCQMRWIEARLSSRSRHIAFISPRDREAVMKGRPGGVVVPNGVEIEYWTRRRAAGDNCLVFTGVMDYPPNADAALFLLDRVLPEIRRVVPDVGVIIAGRSPLPRLLKTAQGLRGVTVTGFVDDLRPYLERAAVFVAPLRFASGTQNKLLEAMAMELPVVTTAIAADGLRVDGADPPVLAGERPADLAAHVIRLLQNPGARRRLGSMGRQFVSRHFEWERGAELLERMCLDAISRPERAAASERPQSRAGPRFAGRGSSGPPAPVSASEKRQVHLSQKEGPL